MSGNLSPYDRLKFAHPVKVGFNAPNLRYDFQKKDNVILSLDITYPSLKELKKYKTQNPDLTFIDIVNSQLEFITLKKSQRIESRFRTLLSAMACDYRKIGGGKKRQQLDLKVKKMAVFEHELFSARNLSDDLANECSRLSKELERASGNQRNREATLTNVTGKLKHVSESCSLTQRNTETALNNVTGVSENDSLTQYNTETALDNVTGVSENDSLTQYNTETALNYVTGVSENDSLTRYNMETALDNVAGKLKQMSESCSLTQHNTEIALNNVTGVLESNSLTQRNPETALDNVAGNKLKQMSESDSLMSESYNLTQRNTETALYNGTGKLKQVSERYSLTKFEHPVKFGFNVRNLRHDFQCENKVALTLDITYPFLKELKKCKSKNPDLTFIDIVNSQLEFITLKKCQRLESRFRTLLSAMACDYRKIGGGKKRQQLDLKVKKMAVFEHELSSVKNLSEDLANECSILYKELERASGNQCNTDTARTNATGKLKQVSELERASRSRRSTEAAPTTNVNGKLKQVSESYSLTQRNIETVLHNVTGNLKQESESYSLTQGNAETVLNNVTGNKLKQMLENYNLGPRNTETVLHNHDVTGKLQQVSEIYSLTQSNAETAMNIVNGNTLQQVSESCSSIQRNTETALNNVTGKLKQVSERYSLTSKCFDNGMRVGEDFQAKVPEYNPDIKPEGRNDAILVWAPAWDLPDAKVDEYVLIAKEKHGYNTEQALGMLFWHKHNVDKALSDLPNFTPFPDEWTVEDKVLFEQAFSFHGKSFHRIRQMLPDKSIASLVKYYYSWKKTRSRTSLMDRQARKLTKNGESDDDSDIINKNSDTEDANKENGKQEKDTCSNCGITTSTLNPTPKGSLCQSCYQYWRRTGVMRSAGPNRHDHGQHRHNPMKHKRKPPRGMFITGEDLSLFTSGPPVQSESVLKNAEADLVSLKRQVQNNKQMVSMQKHKMGCGIDDLRPPEGNQRINARWTNEELLLAVQGVRKYGKDFQAIAEVICNKTEAHVRSFFINFRRRYNLDEVLAEYEAEHGTEHVVDDDLDKEEEKMEVDIKEIDNTVPNSGVPPPLLKQGSPIKVPNISQPRMIPQQRTILQQPPPLIKPNSSSPKPAITTS